MLRFLLLASLVACSLGAATRRRPGLDGRIVGGWPVTIEEFPYQVSLEYNGDHICGGSIISPYWVVTSAMCVSVLSVSDVKFRAGSSMRGSGGTLHPAAEIITHPLFDWYNVDFNVAVVRLSVPFYYGPGVQPISLTSTEPAVGSIAVVSGWGQFSESDTTLPSQLQAVSVFILSRPECDYIFGSGVITENKFCTDVPGGGNGYCFGDQGGPLVADGQLVGIVHSGNGCAAFYHPGIYSNIATLKDFITEQTGVQ